jgi:glucose-6-phosphate 1-epimerase
MTRTAADFRRWEIPGIATFSDTPGGLVRLDLTPALCRAQVFLHGAHVAAFQPAGAQPVLFMSTRSHFENGKPIRGGVPVIFPWFGPRAGHPDAPAHGLVRTVPWEIESLTSDGKTASLVLFVESNEATRAQWPHDFTLRHRITAGAELSMTLEVTNRSAAPFTFEEALHTYFTISDINAVTATGFEDADYLDKTDGAQRKTQDREPIRITEETDRVYLNTRATCAIHDPGMSRTIEIEKSGSDTTVLWNPWTAKAARLTDLGDVWPGMLCIETANAAENAVTLAPGATHAMNATIRLR